jgi:hypothetical protein
MMKNYNIIDMNVVIIPIKYMRFKMVYHIRFRLFTATRARVHIKPLKLGLLDVID